MFFSRNEPLVGVDIGTSSIKLVKLGKKKGSYSLEHFGMLPLPEGLIDSGEITDPNELSSRLKALTKSDQLRSRKAVAALSGDQVVIKKISLPVMPLDELEETIMKEADQYLPFSLDECNIDYQIIKQPTEDEIKMVMSRRDDTNEEGPQMELFLIAVHKEKAGTLHTIFRNAGLDLVIIDINLFALENCFELNYGFGNRDVVALVDIGTQATSINVVVNRMATFTRDIPIAGNYFTHKIAKDLGVDTDEANQMKFGIASGKKGQREIIKSILEGIDELGREIGKAFEYFSTGENMAIDKVYFSGGGVGLTGIERVLGDKLQLSVDIIDPFKNISINPKIFDPEYIRLNAPMASVATGLATREFLDK